MLPRALRRIAGSDFADLPWRNRGSGFKEAVLPDATAAARFIRARPGARLPIACDAGSVTAVVLAGAASAGGARYERGDVIFTGPEMADAPAVAGEEECVCYVVAEAPAKPAGPLSRMLHLVTGG
jgi:putative transcriptional regulator